MVPAMTPLLDGLLRDFGYLAAMIGNLDAAREIWARQTNTYDVGFCRRAFGGVFQEAYEQGKTNFRRETPGFLYGMCLIHAFGLLEYYLTDLIRMIAFANPRILLTPSRDTDRKIDYRTVIESIDSPNALLNRLVDRELLDLTYKSFDVLLSSLRNRFGLKHLDDRHDQRLIQLALLRNCIVHNHGQGDERLAKASRNFYRAGSRLTITRNMVSRSITTFSSFAMSVDAAAEVTHFGETN
jgi:hypothetical protein